MSDLTIIAQCQRCGRGFITVGTKLKDQYFHPERIRERVVCNGEVKRLATPAFLAAFQNYGSLLPTRDNGTKVAPRPYTRRNEGGR